MTSEPRPESYGSPLGRREPEKRYQRQAIALTIDRQYILPAATMLRSIDAHLRSGLRFRVLVLNADLEASHREELRELVRSERLDIEFLSVAGDYSDLPVERHIKTATYYRLLIASLCRELDRVLFLDADLIVMRDVVELFEMDLGPFAVAAVQDLFNPKVSSPRALPGFASAYGVDPSAKYFNSGVMIIQMARWRERDVEHRALEFLRRHRQHVGYWEQDALNAVLIDAWLALDRRWNVFPLTEILRGPKTHALLEDSLPLEEALALEADPFILHFVGGQKPWNPAFPSGRNLDRFERYLPPSANL